MRRKRFVHAYRRRRNAVNFLAFVFGAYLAIAAILEGAQQPSATAWQPWSIWFIAGLVAAIVIPAFALLKGLDAQHAERTAEARELDADMARICQEIAAAISHECDELRLEHLAVQVWLCDEATGAFDRRWRFFLPFDRKASGIVWRRGLGVAGTAWASKRDLVAPLASLRQMSQSEFEKLAEHDRYGMSYEQLGAASAYTGIIAARLHTEQTGDKLLGMLVIDYSGKDGFDCVSDSLKASPVVAAIGACARRLSASNQRRRANEDD